MKLINRGSAILLAFILSLNLTTPIYASAVEGQTVVRAAIDIGSGATKLRVAEIDLKKKSVNEILATKSYAVSYQSNLIQSADGSFDSEVMSEGLEAIKSAVAIAKEKGAKEVIAVATEAFRRARNAEKFIALIEKETGVKVNIIDQELEGILAFEAVHTQLGIPMRQLVVWDIGGGSLQITIGHEEGSKEAYRAQIASSAFKNMVIENVQKRSLLHHKTPNPINAKEISSAEVEAKKLAKKVDALFKEKIAQADAVVVGVGNIFGYGIAELVDNGREITQKRLKEKINSLADKSDGDLGGGPYANVRVTNAIFVLGYMKELKIERMLLTDINPADGAFFYSPFWESAHLQGAAR